MGRSGVQDQPPGAAIIPSLDYTGLVDNQAAIQAALDACNAQGGGVVDLSPSRIAAGATPIVGTSQIITYSNTWIRAYGTTVKKLGNGDLLTTYGFPQLTIANRPIGTTVTVGTAGTTPYWYAIVGITSTGADTAFAKSEMALTGNTCATVGAPGSISNVINWTGNAACTGGYKIVRSPNGGNLPGGSWVLIGTVAAGVTTFTDTAAAGSTSYLPPTVLSDLGGPVNSGIFGGRWDGNQAAGFTGRVWSHYGYGQVWRDAIVCNAQLEGIYSEWTNYQGTASAHGDSMESEMHKLQVHDCVKEGIIYNGPHDSVADDLHVVNNSVAGDGLYTGIWIQSRAGGGEMVTNSHVWGRHGWAWMLDATGLLANCTGEGATIGSLQINTNDCNISGGHWYGSPYIIEIGGKGAVTGTFISSKVTDYSTAGIHFANDGGSTIFVHGYKVGLPLTAGAMHTLTNFIGLALGGGATGTQVQLQGPMTVKGQLSVTGASFFSGATSQSRVLTTLASAGAVSLNAQAGDVHDVTLNATASSVTIANPTDKQRVELSIIGGAGGPWTVTAWAANIKWAANTPPTVSTVAGLKDTYSFRYDGVSTNWHECAGRTLAVPV